MKLELWNVLAGAYPRGNPKTCLMHWVQVDDKGDPVSVLCGRVKLESLCEPVEAGPHMTLCKACERKKVKLVL